MTILLWVLGPLVIFVLAFVFYKARKNTPLAKTRACTPYVEGMRWLEEPGADNTRKETLW